MEIMDAEPVAALVRIIRFIDEFDQVLEAKPCAQKSRAEDGTMGDMLVTLYMTGLTIHVFAMPIAYSKHEGEWIMGLFMGMVTAPVWPIMWAFYFYGKLSE